MQASNGHCSHNRGRLIQGSNGHCSHHGGRFIQGSYDHCSHHRGRFIQGSKATVPTPKVDLYSYQPLFLRQRQFNTG